MERTSVQSFSPGFVSIKDPGEQHTVKFERDIVGRDGALLGDLESHLLQALDVGDPVQEGDEDGQAGVEDAIELAHALDDPRRLLGHEADDGVGR